MSSAQKIRAGKAYVEVSAIDKTGKGLSSAEERLKAFKKSFGEESVFGNTLKALRGAGAFAGLGMAAQSLNAITGKAVEMQGLFASGAASAGDVAENLWQSVPVLGQIRQAGLNIRELFDGSAASVASMVRHASNANAAISAFRKTVEISAASLKAMRDVLLDVRVEGAQIGAAGGWAKWLQAQEKAGRRAKQIRENVAAEAERMRNLEIDVTGPDGKVTKMPAADRAKELQKQLDALDRRDGLQEQLANKSYLQRGLSAAQQLGDQGLIDQITAAIDQQNHELADYTQERNEIATELAAVNSAITGANAAAADIGSTIFGQAAGEALRGNVLNLLREGKLAAGEFFGAMRDGFARMVDQVKGVDTALEDFFGGLEQGYQDRIKRIVEDVKTPLERFGETMDELDAMRSAGDITQETYDRASQNAQDQLAGDIERDRERKRMQVQMDSMGTFSARVAEQMAARPMRVASFGDFGGRGRQDDEQIKLLAQVVNVLRDIQRGGGSLTD